MSTKLTLSVREDVIEQAKAYAKSHNTSVSKLIERYLSTLSDTSKGGNIEITPLVKSLSGVIKLDADFDYREEYTKHLIEKYK